MTGIATSPSHSCLRPHIFCLFERTILDQILNLILPETPSALDFAHFLRQSPYNIIVVHLPLLARGCYFPPCWPPCPSSAAIQVPDGILQELVKHRQSFRDVFGY